MSISRRTALATGAAAIVTGATVAPLAVKTADPEEEQVLALFRQMGDAERASCHFWIRYYAGLPDDPQIRQRFTGGLPS